LLEINFIEVEMMITIYVFTLLMIVAL